MSYLSTGNCLDVHIGMQFTTPDIDNDNASSRNCAQQFRGRWWYYDCFTSNLNAHYDGHYTAHYDDAGIACNSFESGAQRLRKSELKFRPIS